MNRKTAFLAAAWAIVPVAAVVVVATVTPVTAETNTGNRAAAATDPKSLFTEKCSACHNLPNPTELSYTRAEWQRVVNTMLVRYKASDEISPSEASEIVNYLATFAPHDRGPAGGPGQSGDRLWASEPTDVAAEIPTRSIIDNFEAPGPLSALSREASGTGKPVWRAVSSGGGLDGNVVRVSNAGATPDSFALLVDPRAKGADVDVKVRFRFISGSASPAVGIAIGVRDSRHYSVVRYNQKSGDLSMIDVAEPTHTTVQRTPIEDVNGDLKTVALEWKPGQWHTLRVQVKGGRVRGWIDSYKRINADLPGYSGGAVALWSQGDTVAVFDDWSTDVYDRS